MDEETEDFGGDVVLLVESVRDVRLRALMLGIWNLEFGTCLSGISSIRGEKS